VRVVKSFVREDFEEEKFKESNRDLKKAGMSASKLMILMQPVMSIFMNGAIIAVVWFGQKEVLAGGMEVGDLSAFLTYVTQILFSLIMVTVLLVMSARPITSVKRIKKVLNEQPDITDDTEKALLTEIDRGDIDFKNGSF
jgi:ATP-binding cassette subfamily B protein